MLGALRGRDEMEDNIVALLAKVPDVVAVVVFDDAPLVLAHVGARIHCSPIKQYDSGLLMKLRDVHEVVLKLLLERDQVRLEQDVLHVTQLLDVDKPTPLHGKGWALRDLVALVVLCLQEL